MEPDYATSLDDAQNALKTARRLLEAEIAAYPTPISGCDAQFNHLLAERHRIGDAIQALGAEVFIATPRRPDPLSRIESR